MEPRTTIGTVAAVAFCAGITVSFFTLPVWVTFAINFAREGSRSDWLGVAGSVTGGLMTLIAATIAFWAVQEQIRAQRQAEARQAELNRIERELPGLWGANNLARRFIMCKVTFGAPHQRIVEEFKTIGAVQNRGADFDAAIERIIPSAPRAVRSELSFLLRTLRINAGNLLRSEQKWGAHQAAESDSDVAAREAYRRVLHDTFAASFAELGEFGNALVSRIKAEEQRANVLRREQDRFLDLNLHDHGPTR